MSYKGAAAARMRLALLQNYCIFRYQKLKSHLVMLLDFFFLSARVVLRYCLGILKYLYIITIEIITDEIIIICFKIIWYDSGKIGGSKYKLRLAMNW